MCFAFLCNSLDATEGRLSPLLFPFPEPGCFSHSDLTPPPPPAPLFDFLPCVPSVTWSPSQAPGAARPFVVGLLRRVVRAPRPDSSLDLVGSPATPPPSPGAREREKSRSPRRRLCSGFPVLQVYRASSKPARAREIIYLKQASKKDEHRPQ